MNSTQSSDTIATTRSNCKEDIANRIIERNRRRIADALADGCDYLQTKKLMRGDTFKIWLKSIGKTTAEAMRYAKLYQVFAEFSIEALAQLSLPTLFALCQKRYQQLVAKLRTRWGKRAKLASVTACTEMQVQQMMAEEREQQKIEKPLRDRTGLINLPSGGRAFQFPLLHDDETIAKILRVQEYRQDLTPVRLMIDAIALLFEQEDRLHRCKEHLSEYRINARSSKDWHYNAEILQRVREEEIVARKSTVQST